MRMNGAGSNVLWQKVTQRNVIKRTYKIISWLMPEVPHPGKPHRQSHIVSGLDDFGVAHRSAWLDDGRRTRLGSSQQTVGEWKKRIRGNDRYLGTASAQACRTGGLGSFHRADADGINAAHLARANARRRAAPGIDDRIRLHMFGNPKCKFEFYPFRLTRHALADHAQLHVVNI